MELFPHPNTIPGHPLNPGSNPNNKARYNHPLTQIRRNQTFFNRPDLQQAITLFKALPPFIPEKTTIHTDTISAQHTRPDPATIQAIQATVRELIPWRKGPFNLFGLQLDAEWDSAMKWNRIISAVGTLTGERVLDVGASSGYYMYRMKALNPKWILGVDPSPRFRLQFETIQKYIQSSNLFYETLTLADVAPLTDHFDTIFCLGILGHRKNPYNALSQCRSCLRPGGRLFLETLIIPGETDNVLCPEDTYSKMRNVYFVPTIKTLKSWIRRCGFDSVELIDESVTTHEEQRNSEYCPLPYQSLNNFLDPNDSSKTVEGYPAPRRAVLLAR